MSEKNIWKRWGVKFVKAEGQEADNFNNMWWIIGALILVVLSLIRAKFF